MTTNLLVLKILAKYKCFVVSHVVVEDLIKSPELKDEIKELKKPRQEGGYGWDTQKIKLYLVDKYRFEARGAFFCLRKQGYIVTKQLKNEPKRMKNVLLGKHEITKKEVAHKITSLGLKKLCAKESL